MGYGNQGHGVSLDQTRRAILVAATNAGVLSTQLASGAGSRPVDDRANSGADRTRADDDSWPMDRHDAGRTGYNPGSQGPQTGVRERWRVNRTAPTVGDGMVYFGGERLTAIDVADGTVDWTRTPEHCSYTTPVIGDETVYAGVRTDHQDRRTGTAQAFDADTGDRRWATEPLVIGSTHATLLTPVLANATLFVVGITGGSEAPAKQAGTFAVDVDSGAVRWQHELDQPGRSLAVVDGTVVFTNGEQVRALGDRRDTTLDHRPGGREFVCGVRNRRGGNTPNSRRP